MEQSADPDMASFAKHLYPDNMAFPLPAKFNCNRLLARMNYGDNGGWVHQEHRELHTILVSRRLTYKRFLKMTVLIETGPGYELRKFKNPVQLIELIRDTRYNEVNTFRLDSFKPTEGYPIVMCRKGKPVHLERISYQ